MGKIVQYEKALKSKIKTTERTLAGLREELAAVGEVKSGDRPNCEQAKLMKSQRFSFTVHFERNKVLRKVRSPGAVCKSLRRFTSRKEAIQHGKRFSRIHRHKGYEVVRVAKRANAWINWRTGKTNPVLNG